MGLSTIVSSESVKKLGQSDLHFGTLQVFLCMGTDREPCTIVESMSVLGETILDDLDVPKDHRKSV